MNGPNIDGVYLRNMVILEMNGIQCFTMIDLDNLFLTTALIPSYMDIERKIYLYYVIYIYIYIYLKIIHVFVAQRS